MNKSGFKVCSVIDLNKKWYEVSLPLRTCSLKDVANSTISKEQIDAYYQEAQQILDEETKSSELDRGRWYSFQFLARGTIADKVASAAVKLTDNDFMFFLDGFNLLFDTARTDTHHYEAALKALSAIWPKLLPPRPLKKFVSQYFTTLPQLPTESTHTDYSNVNVTNNIDNGFRNTNTKTNNALVAATIAQDGVSDAKSYDSTSNKNNCNNNNNNNNNTNSVEQAHKTILTMARRKVLLYWYLEDHLKRTYAQFMSLCETMLKDRIAQRREAWMSVTGKLMCTVAESRHLAMSMMIDKLGDPNSQLAHQAYHCLLKLLSESSTHQASLFTELEKIIFMKNCPLRTMRYAANVMNQFVYSKEERKLALRSVHTYLSLFRQLAMSGAADSTVTTAILVGLRRAFPYAGVDMHSLQTHLDALFVLANNGNFQQRVATMSLLQLIVTNKGTSVTFLHRWYRALYQLLLLSPKQIPQTTQLTSFFAMLHKAMRTDSNDERVAAFVHRLLQRALYLNPAMICAILLLVGEMVSTRPLVRQLIQPSSSSKHHVSCINHLRQERKETVNTTNKSVSKQQQQQHRGLEEKTQTTEHDANSNSNSNNNNNNHDCSSNNNTRKWMKDNTSEYDPRAREPQFAHASHECLWVLNTLAHHFHPSVIKLAVLLLFGEDVIFDVHPLDDMTPANFLQMFVEVQVHSNTSLDTNNNISMKSGTEDHAFDKNEKGTNTNVLEGHPMLGKTETMLNSENERHTGISVFRRATHIPYIPSASDPYFVHASASEVDVAALFLHRYAVQREKFHNALKETKSTWGDASGEEDVAIRVSNLDNALFGPEGKLIKSVQNTDSNNSDDNNKSISQPANEASKRVIKKKNESKRILDNAEIVERDEDVQSSSSSSSDSDEDESINEHVHNKLNGNWEKTKSRKKGNNLGSNVSSNDNDGDDEDDVELNWGYDNDEDDDENTNKEANRNKKLGINDEYSKAEDNEHGDRSYLSDELEESEEESNDDDDKDDDGNQLVSSSRHQNRQDSSEVLSHKRESNDDDNGEDFAREIEQHLKQTSHKRQRE